MVLIHPFWRHWSVLHRTWWARFIYLLILVGSYISFAEAFLYLTFLDSPPSTTEILVIVAGFIFGGVGILLTFLDCIFLYCRRSELIQPTALSTPNPMLAVSNTFILQQTDFTNQPIQMSSSKLVEIV